MTTCIVLYNIIIEDKRDLETSTEIRKITSPNINMEEHEILFLKTFDLI